MPLSTYISIPNFYRRSVNIIVYSVFYVECEVQPTFVRSWGPYNEVFPRTDMFVWRFGGGWLSFKRNAIRATTYLFPPHECEENWIKWWWCRYTWYREIIPFANISTIHTIYLNDTDEHRHCPALILRYPLRTIIVKQPKMWYDTMDFSFFKNKKLGKTV